jgi:hypothetical protein
VTVGGGAPAVPAPCDDDPAIPDSESVYRRLSDTGPSMIAVDLATHKRRPTSGAFKPDAEGVSIYRKSKLDAAALTHTDLVRGPQNVVVSLEVGEIRSVAHLAVRDDPWPADVDDPSHARNSAHALIVGWSGLSKNQRIERQRTLTRLPSLNIIV